MRALGFEPYFIKSVVKIFFAISADPKNNLLKWDKNHTYVNDPQRIRLDHPYFVVFADGIAS